MIVSYIDILGDKERHEIKATVTTDHPASSYGIPVVVLPDGESLDIASWILLSYAVVEATREELASLTKALSPYTTPMQEAASELARRGGQAKSERKAAASRLNGRKGGRPRKP